MNVYEENYKLKKQIEQYKKDLSNIHSILYCIGGPLNDNVLQYSKKQRVTFSQISKIIKHNL